MPDVQPEPEYRHKSQEKRETLSFQYYGEADMINTLLACRWCDPERYPTTTRMPPWWDIEEVDL